MSAAAFIKPAESATGPGKDAAKADAGKPAGRPDAKADSTSARPQAVRPASVAMPAPASGGGLRAAATHLAAGLAGGLLVLLGADALAPTLGLTQSPAPALTADLGRRLQALEAGAGRAAAPAAELAQKLAAAEAKLARLDDIARTVGTLSTQHTQLAQDAKSLGEKLAQTPTDTAAPARLTRLEDTLATLSAAAVGDPQRGRIPQLAAITGRIADLESNLNTQLTALRRNVTQEVDSRLTGATEASEVARIGTQRVDRDLATVKTEASQLANRIDGVKAAAERAEMGVRGLKDESGEIKTVIDAIKGDLARELKQVARPNDVANAITPMVGRLAALEENVQGVVKGENDRRANAERIVLALELGNLKRTVERGAPFLAELAEVRRVGGPALDLATLERHKERGVPTVADLAREFRGLAHAIIDAEAEPANTAWTDRLLAGAKSIVRVRRVDQGPDDTSIEATVARIEANLRDGKLVDVAAEAGKIPAKALAPARGWLDKVEARVSVERAMGEIERELKASLGAGGQSGVPAGKKG